MHRVLHCIHSLVGGGAETQLRLLVNNTDNKQVTSAVFCVNAQGAELLSNDVRLYVSASARKYNVSIFSSLHKAIKDFSPDIVHAWLPASMTVPAMAIAKLHGVPCIFSFRNRMLFHRPISYPEYIFAMLFAKRIVSNNPLENSIAPFQWLYKRKKGLLIENAVQVDTSETVAEVLPASLRDKKKILYAGRLVKQKNVGCLIQSLSYLNPDQDWHLIVCGEGDNQADLQKSLAATGLEDRVSWLGFRSDVSQIMREVDIFVLPSKFEGMPNVLLEAIAIGLPCVVSDIIAHRHLVSHEHTAMFFDPESAEDLATSLSMLLDNEALAEALIKNSRDIAKNHSIEVFCQKYLRFYASI